MSRDGKKRIEKLLRELNRAGWSPEQRRSGYFHVRNPETNQLVVVTATPSDHRSYMNTERDLKKAGYVFERDRKPRRKMKDVVEVTLLRDRRIENNLSLSQLERRTGIPKGTLQSAEANGRTGRHNVGILARVLGCSVVDLTGEAPAPNAVPNEVPVVQKAQQIEREENENVRKETDEEIVTKRKRPKGNTQIQVPCEGLLSIRMARNLTQQQLAQRINVSASSTISGWETRGTMQKDYLEPIAAALGVRVELIQRNPIDLLSERHTSAALSPPVVQAPPAVQTIQRPEAKNEVVPSGYGDFTDRYLSDLYEMDDEDFFGSGAIETEIVEEPVSEEFVAESTTVLHVHEFDSPLYRRMDRLCDLLEEVATRPAS